jgi:hypothetical protein
MVRRVMDRRTRRARSRRTSVRVVVAIATTILASVGLAVAAAPAGAAGPLWTRTVAPAGALALGDAHVVTARTGDIYVALTVQRADTGNDLWLARYAPTGSRRWQRFYDGTSHLNDALVALVADRDGNVTVLSQSRSATTGDDLLLVHYGRDGRRLWVRRIDGGVKGQDEADDLLVDRAGNLYAVGTLRRAGSGFDLAVVKFRPSGARSWTRVYDVLGETEVGGPAALAPDGRLYVCGQMAGADGSYDFLFVCFTTGGEYKWSRHWGLSDNSDLVRDVAADSRGPVAVGWTDSISDYSDGLVVAFGPDGDFRWYEAYDGPANRSDDLSAVGLDRDGRVYVAGYATGTSVSYDFFLGRYGVNGGGLQSTLRNGFEDATDEASCLAVSADGRSYAGGLVRLSPGDTTAYFLGYDATWSQADLGVYDGDGTVADSYEGVALSSSAVYLAGRSGLRVLIEKYAR